MPFGFGMAGGGGGGGTQSLSSMLKLHNAFSSSDGTTGNYAATKGNFSFEAPYFYGGVSRNVMSHDGTSTKYIPGGASGRFFAGAKMAVISMWVKISSSTGSGTRKLFAFGSTGSYLGVSGTDLVGSFSCTDATRTFTVTDGAPRDVWKLYHVQVYVNEGNLVVGVFDEGYYDPETGGTPLYWGTISGTGSLSFGTGALALLGTVSANSSVVGKVAGFSMASDMITNQTFAGTPNYYDSEYYAKTLQYRALIEYGSGAKSNFYSIPVYCPLSTSTSVDGVAIRSDYREYVSEIDIDLSSTATDKYTISKTADETGVTVTRSVTGFDIITTSANSSTEIYINIDGCVVPGVSSSFSIDFGDVTLPDGTDIQFHNGVSAVAVNTSGNEIKTISSTTSVGYIRIGFFSSSASGKDISVNIKSINISVDGSTFLAGGYTTIVDEGSDVLSIDTIAGAGLMPVSPDLLCAASGTYYFDLGDDLSISFACKYSSSGATSWPDRKNEIIAADDSGDGVFVFGSIHGGQDLIGVSMVNGTFSCAALYDISDGSSCAVRFNSNGTMTCYSGGVEISPVLSSTTGTKTTKFVTVPFKIGDDGVGSAGQYSAAISDFKLYIGELSNDNLVSIS